MKFATPHHLPCRRAQHLAKVFLTGAINERRTFDGTDFRNTVPRFNPEGRKANRVLVELLGRIASRKDATPAQVALA